MSQHPFILPTPKAHRERHDTIDVYRSAESPEPARVKQPIVVFVHGGPRPPDVDDWRPRDHPMFVGYGSIVAERGAIGVTVQHHMDTLAHCRTAAEEVAAGVELARTLPGVDRDRVALWFFSGGGLLTTDWLRNPPSWLTCIALTYPVLDTVPEWGVDPHVDPVDAVRSVGQLPILLTKVGRERPEFIAGVDAFITAAAEAEAELDIIDLPKGTHGFDMFDDSPASRDAVTTAIEWVLTTTTRDLP
jgi:dienelactone hydrolase